MKKQRRYLYFYTFFINTLANQYEAGKDLDEDNDHLGRAIAPYLGRGLTKWTDQLILPLRKALKDD